MDPAGGFVVVDEGNHRVRKVWPDGTITTIAGNGNDTGTFLDGSPATAVPLRRRACGGLRPTASCT